VGRVHLGPPLSFFGERRKAKEALAELGTPDAGV